MGRRHMPTVDDQLKHLTKKLNLSDDQQAKLKPILEDQRKQMDGIRNDSSLSREDRFSKMQETSAKLRHSDQERAERRSAEEFRQDARRAGQPDEAMAQGGR